MPPQRVLYCHCAYARVVPEAVKEEVLRGLAASGIAFDAVPDLCELSAKNDPALKQLADADNLRIAACYPRAVKWLFNGAGVTLPESARVLNMRVESADQVLGGLLDETPGEAAA